MASEAKKKKRDLVLRIVCWWLQLQDYDFEEDHRPGIRMKRDDALSRNPVVDNIQPTENYIFRIKPDD